MVSGSRPHAAPGGRSRAALAAATISDLAHAANPGDRLGSRDDLRLLCGVSVGTLHEALRLVQSTGEVVVRSGPGGGVFAGDSPVLSELVRSVQTRTAGEPDYAQVARILDALNPLIIEDAVAALDDSGSRLLRARLEALRTVRDVGLRDFVRASLELFATTASMGGGEVLRVVAGAILRVQLDALRLLSGPVDPRWTAVADQHLAAVTDMVEAVIAGDSETAIAVRGRPEFMAIFRALAAEGYGQARHSEA